MSDLPCFIRRAPDGWSILPLRLIGQIGNGATPSSGEPSYWDGDVVWVTPDDLGKLVGRDLATSARKLTQAGYLSCGTRLIPANSIILSTRAPIGHLAIARVQACVNQGCRSITLNRDHVPEFFFYQLHAAKGDLASLGSGSTFRELSREKLSGFKLLVPPAETQRAIADFLDRETAKIDALIAKQQELIERIDDHRRAEISKLVSKGLNDTLPMRSSGLPWLGEIPEHWIVQSVWMNFALGRGRVISHQDIAAASGDYPVYSSQTENDGVLGHLKTYDFDGEYLTWTTDGANAGTVFRRSGRFNATNVCGTLKPTRRLDLSFFKCAIEVAAKSFVRLDINPKLMNNVMAKIKVAVPPLAEQTEIARIIQNTEARIIELRNRTESIHDILSERRSALITAAVTGQIDVRAAPIKTTLGASNDNQQTLRVIVGAEIVARHGTAKNFGRVKFQKLLYLAEVHTGIFELGGNYVREAAGPLARDLLSETEHGLAVGGFYKAVAPVSENDGVAYERIGAVGAHSDQFTALLGEKAAPLTKLIDLLKDYSTRDVEAITTLYAVWNDALLDGENPDDARIIRGFLDEWHPEKRVKFKASDLPVWLAWMKRNGVVPSGSGAHTYTDQLFV